MAGYIKVEVEKLKLKFINSKVNAVVFERFQKKCKERNLQMCTVIETFARQYSKGRYKIDENDILKWKRNFGETAVLNTPINKDVYEDFKYEVKSNGYFVKYVLMAFVEDYVNKDLIMEFRMIDK